MARAWEVPGLTGRLTFREAAGHVILTRWREMMSYREGTLLGQDIEELHAMRVSSRRLRAAMDAFAPAFPPKGFRTHLRQVKEVTDVLGEARDLDVAVDGLQAVAREMTEQERPGVLGLAERLRERRGAETAAIADLFARMDENEFASRFEAFVLRHTGVDVARLDPRPPGPGA